MAKSTSARTGGSRAPSPRRPSTGKSPAGATRREGSRSRREAEADAARVRAKAEAEAEAEEHARRLVLDARAAADGVRAEGMELVSSLRQVSDLLRANAERLSADIEAVHARMVRELEAADPGPSADGAEVADRDEVLELPEFVSRG